MNSKTFNNSNEKGTVSSRNSSGSINKIMILSLMKEMDLNPKLQNEILEFTDRGKCLPYVPKELLSSENAEEISVKKLPKLPPKPLQRMKSKIEASGLYERESFRPDPSKIRPAEEKNRLQNLMAFGKHFDDQVEMKVSKEDKAALRISSLDLFDEILKEIKERTNFLEEMNQLGQKKKYLPEIQCQIALRMKELEKLDQDRAQEVYLAYGM